MTFGILRADILAGDSSAPRHDLLLRFSAMWNQTGIRDCADAAKGKLT
jgi:hypothetical protein